MQRLSPNHTIANGTPRNLDTLHGRDHVEIFLDVTGSCRSAKNTGVQRVTRGIYAELAARSSVTAICFNTVGGFYHLLGEPELRYLIAPFSKYKSAVGRPELRGEKLPGELRRCFRRRSIALAPQLHKRGILIVPDIFLDERINLIPAAIKESNGRAVAIFHDAACLRLGIFSPTIAERFRRYVRSLAAFDQVICISEHSRSDLLQLWEQLGIKDPPKTRVESWPLAITPREHPPSSDRQIPTIVCVSSLEARKNHLRLLKAAEKLWTSGCKFELQLVGRSTGPWGRKVVPRIHWLQAKGRPIRWLKHVDDETLLNAYRKCHFTIYPSLAEGFGLPIIESLSHGKPCICGSNGALGEIATAGGCLLVDQTNVADLANAMRLLLKNKHTYTRLAARARERRFRSWAEYGRSLVRLVHDEEKSPATHNGATAPVHNGRLTLTAVG